MPVETKKESRERVRVTSVHGHKLHRMQEQEAARRARATADGSCGCRI